MNRQVKIIDSLKALPCFDEIQTIDLLGSGLSQTSIKVTTYSQVYFVKKLNEETASAEVSCALFCSLKNSEIYLSLQLSPAVLYYDRQWLVTEYISGDTLLDARIKFDVKSSIALTLMAKLHQLPASKIREPIQQLDTNLSFTRLLSKSIPLITKNSAVLHNVAKSLTRSISQMISASGRSSVLCHGDINFTNILIDEFQKPWLIDYECAHIAPAEFDLAMFIAVNNIPAAHLNNVVDEYSELHKDYKCNYELLNHYILYSLFINGLWYLGNKNKNSDSEELFHKLAITQWSSFDTFSLDNGIVMPELSKLLI